VSEFAYRNGVMHVEDVPLPRIAEAVGTPFYCYSRGALVRAYAAFAAALGGLDATICYSIKANGNLAVVRAFAELGAGADVVSGGELERALAAGIRPAQVVFSGVGKTRAELAQALAAGIGQFNVESEAEIETLSALAHARGTRAAVAIRINPDIDALTHDKIATGRASDKFGIPWPDARVAYRRAAALPGLAIAGIAIHIGSQMTSLVPLEAAFCRVADAVAMLRADGHGIRRIDLGGGLGIAYRFAVEGQSETVPSPADYGAVVRRVIAPLGAEIICEPGRALVGDAGVLVTQVILCKRNKARAFVVVDAAMNDLIRPALYGAYHEILPVRAPAAGAERAPVDVVGPVCESSDFFARERPLPPVAAGDVLVVASAGAYGAVNSSTYNARALVPEVMVSGNAFAVVRRRLTVTDMLALETVPDWLGERPVARRGAA